MPITQNNNPLNDNTSESNESPMNSLLTQRLLDAQSNNSLENKKTPLAETKTDEPFELRLVDKNLTDKDFPFLVLSLQQHASIFRLVASRNRLTWKTVALLCRILKQNLSVTEFILDHNNLKDKGAAFASHLLLLGEPTLIDISANQITAAGVANLTNALISNESLETFSLASNPIGDNGFLNLANAIRLHPNLTILNVANTGLTDAIVPVIEKLLQHNFCIRAIDLTGNQFSPEKRSYLSQLLTSRQTKPRALNPSSKTLIHNLSLAEKKLDDNDMPLLANFILQNTELQSLELQKNRITATGLRILFNAIIQQGNLQELNLWKNPLQDEGAAVLGELLPHAKSLTSLDLNQTEIGPAGAKELAPALQKSALSHLDLSYNNLMDIGGNALALSLKNNIKLRSLCLARNGLTDESITALLHVLREKAQLVSVDLADNPISNELNAGEWSQYTYLFTFAALKDQEIILQDMLELIGMQKRVLTEFLEKKQETTFCSSTMRVSYARASQMQFNDLVKGQEVYLKARINDAEKIKLELNKYKKSLLERMDSFLIPLQDGDDLKEKISACQQEITIATTFLDQLLHTKIDLSLETAHELSQRNYRRYDKLPVKKNRFDEAWDLFTRRDYALQSVVPLVESKEREPSSSLLSGLFRRNKRSVAVSKDSSMKKQAPRTLS